MSESAATETNINNHKRKNKHLKLNDCFPSKYIKADDLEDDTVVTIKKVVIEELESKDGKNQDKPVMYFKEFEKGLVVNRTNWTIIAKQHGEDSELWTNKQIILFAMDVEAFGEMVSAIRVKPPRKIAPKGAPMMAAPESGAAHEQTKSEVANDDAVTAFWTEVKKSGRDRKEGLEILSVHKGDFAAALKDVQMPF